MTDYRTVNDDARKKLTQVIDALAEPLSQVAREGRTSSDDVPSRTSESRWGRRAGRGGRSPRPAWPRASPAPPSPPRRPTCVDFYGAHQAGIATAAPDRLAFASYDVVTTGTVSQRRAALIDLLKAWTAAAAAMTGGHTVPGDNTNPDAPPADTGEAFGARPANLTITLGFGPSLFDDRFGLSGSGRPRSPTCRTSRRPTSTRRSSDGDLCIQACSDDPIVAFHAIRNLARIGRGTVVMRWSQLGFGKAIGTGDGSRRRPRNLMGFKDGTRNIEPDRRRRC